jgi:hypothetical protein
MTETRISVNGDAEAGWIVDVHDGDRQGVYSPDGKTAAEAITAALKEHAGEGKTKAKAEAKPDEKPEEKPAPRPTPPPAQPHPNPPSPAHPQPTATQQAVRPGTKAG